jgi:hypothetical protein
MLSAHHLLRVTSWYFLVRSPHLHDPSHMPIHRSVLVTMVTRGPTNLLVMHVLNCSLANPSDVQMFSWNLNVQRLVVCAVPSETVFHTLTEQIEMIKTRRQTWDLLFPWRWLWRLITPGTWHHAVYCYMITKICTCRPPPEFMLWHVDRC